MVVAWPHLRLKLWLGAAVQLFLYQAFPVQGFFTRYSDKNMEFVVVTKQRKSYLRCLYCVTTNVTMRLTSASVDTTSPDDM